MLLLTFVAVFAPVAALASPDGPSESKKSSGAELREISHKEEAGASHTLGFRRRTGYLQVSPGGLAFGANMTYVWGLSGGYHLPIGRRFVLQTGVFFDHHIAVYQDPPTPLPTFLSPLHDLVVGAEIRPGASTRRFFGYPLFRIGAELPIYSHGIGFDGANVLLSLGGGAQFLVHRHVAIGGEPAFDFPSSLSDFAIFTFRARIFVAVVF